MTESLTLIDDQSVRFDPRFMLKHAGQIISNPRIAVVELIANAYDAGATRVEITWPAEIGEMFEIVDNGCGMTDDEFNARWNTLNYNRLDSQGDEVTFPPGVNASTRLVLGQNGVGRHGAFCFSNSFTVETWKNGSCTAWQVALTRGGSKPFSCEVVGRESREGSGTRIAAKTMLQWISIEDVRECIGSKFLVDPSFEITVNGELLQLFDLKGSRSLPLRVEPYGEVRLYQVSSPTFDRTGRMHGVTWWVCGRMVGQPSWDLLESWGMSIDSRTRLMRRYSFVVEADFLKEDIEPDWSGFKDTDRLKAVRSEVAAFVITAFDDLLHDVREEKKAHAIASNSDAIAELPRVSQKVISHFVDDIQQKCPRLTEGDLSALVGVMTKFEQTRTGYTLLNQLNRISPNEIDTWSRLMNDWNAASAELILGELGRRLKLISELAVKVESEATDELHELQPLFAQGLWMFGPEFEAIEFTSNRAMVTVLKTILRAKVSTGSRNRPDFVVRSNSTIGIYSADAYDEVTGEVNGIRKLMIVELKRGGFTIKEKEVSQGEKYAREIIRKGMIGRDVPIVVYVLGMTVDEYAQGHRNVDQISVRPTPYNQVLRAAHARTFHLQKRLEELTASSSLDLDLLPTCESMEQSEIRFDGETHDSVGSHGLCSQVRGASKEAGANLMDGE